MFLVARRSCIDGLCVRTRIEAERVLASIPENEVRLVELVRSARPSVFVVLVDSESDGLAFADRADAQSEAMSIDADPERSGRVRVLGFAPAMLVERTA